MADIDYKDELEKAYRCIRGMYGSIAKGVLPPTPMLGYHSLTIAAAIRFVDEEALDGSAYFVGKSIDVLKEAMAKYKPEEPKNGSY